MVTSSSTRLAAITGAEVRGDDRRGGTGHPMGRVSMPRCSAAQAPPLNRPLRSERSDARRAPSSSLRRQLDRRALLDPFYNGAQVLARDRCPGLAAAGCRAVAREPEAASGCTEGVPVPCSRGGAGWANARDGSCCAERARRQEPPGQVEQRQSCGYRACRYSRCAISKISSGWYSGVKASPAPSSLARSPPSGGPSTTSRGPLPSSAWPRQTAATSL
jgi:hypothetical protein